MATADLTTPLYDAHLRLNARMVPFAGYSMPVQYESVIAESKAVREGAGMFDVSHMARLRISGARAMEYLEWVTTNDVAKIPHGDGHYSLLPNFEGGVVDDIIVYKINDEDFGMVVNASNHAKDVAWLKSQNSFGVEIQDDTDATAMIAVQGPKATEILAGLATDPELLKSKDMFGSLRTEIAGVPCFAARSGYTGEDGFEIICDGTRAEAVWNSLLQAGVAPCGLGSRDVLRVEAGLPLYGHELNDEMSPLCAGLGWVISKEKDFIGSDKMKAVRESGAPLKLVGVKLDGKRLPQIDMAVMVDGKEVGKVSSGIYSPLLECGLAFAFISPGVALNTPCTIDMRGKAEPGMIVSKRFFKRA
ncbi:MAG: glycine cleavage system aminomethyltransferase GcvT [Chthonomonas sp.]|nr:glycine cleavage system aminomethyltransferase GcvT [Chthonomonas sp.]